MALLLFSEIRLIVAFMSLGECGELIRREVFIGFGVAVPDIRSW